MVYSLFQDGIVGIMKAVIDFLSVGEVMNAVQRNDLAANTVIIFTSDNGPSHLERGQRELETLAMSRLRRLSD